MPISNDTYNKEILDQMSQNWEMFMSVLNQSLEMLEQDIEEVAQMSKTCTSEWCEATEHVLDDLSNMVFSISEPRWAPKEVSERIKTLKRRIHDLYAKYKTASGA